MDVHQTSGGRRPVMCRPNDAVPLQRTDREDLWNTSGLKAIRTSIDTQTKSLLETITDTRVHLHEEIGLMIKGEARITKTLIDTKRRGLGAKLTEVEARAERGGGTGTGAGATKPPKSDGSTPWTAFPAPVRDGSRVQLLDASRNRHTWSRPCRPVPITCYTESQKEQPMKKPLRPGRTASGTSTWQLRFVVT
jgi:hypothetical protein